MKIKDPNPIFFEVFFDIHNSTLFNKIAIPMAENILTDFRKKGYSWLARAFSFKKYPRPPYVDEILGGVLKLEDQSSLPSIED